MATINIMAMRHSAFYAPLLLTIKGGYLTRLGLEPVYTVATADNPVDRNLLSGTAHLSQSAPAVSFATLEQGEPVDIVHFASINERDGFFIAAREPMKTSAGTSWSIKKYWLITCFSHWPHCATGFTNWVSSSTRSR